MPSDGTFELQNISMSGQFFSHLLVSFAAGLVVAFPSSSGRSWLFLAPACTPPNGRGPRRVAFASVLFP